jgi:hypothetical protein
MSYDSKALVSVSFPVVLTTLTYPWQASKSGHVFDIQMSTTTSWAGTTPGRIDVGVLGALNKFATLSTGVTAAGQGKSARYLNTPPANAVLPHADFNAGEQLLITYVPPVGGAPAGAGYVTVTFQLDP